MADISKAGQPVADRNGAEIELERLAAIVSSSDDAIISKTLDGVITSWNAGATRIFGYAPDEMIGQPILRLIPPELHHEEADILARLRRGERIDHFDTVRLARDGRRVNISLTVSPLRDRTGAIVGASKVARDVTERKRSEALQRVLIDELNHRVRNTLATIQGIASQSLQTAASPAAFVESFNGRIQAMARVHDRLVQGEMKGAGLKSLVRDCLQPVARGHAQAVLSGPDVMLDARSAVQLALVLHELATNAAQHGALSVSGGQLTVRWTMEEGVGDERLRLEWVESGVSGTGGRAGPGFGAALIESALAGLGGETDLNYAEDGLRFALQLPLPQAAGGMAPAEAAARETSPPAANTGAAPDFTGKRILVVEDEPIIAMDIEYQLTTGGFEVVGPAATLEKARALIAAAEFDAALLDANLGGQSVGEIAEALSRQGVPFVFATGYGREALPPDFRNVRILPKPFNAQRLVETVATLLSGEGGGATGKSRAPGA